MKVNRVTALSVLSASAFCIQLAAGPALAVDDRVYPADHHYYHKPVTIHDYMSDHPKVRSAAIGAGVGTAAGAITGLVTGRGVLRGAAIGAGAGAGMGLIRTSEILARHPILRDIAMGATVGGGLGMAGGRMPGTAVKSAVVGSAVGLGVGTVKHL